MTSQVFYYSSTDFGFTSMPPSNERIATYLMKRSGALAMCSQYKWCSQTLGLEPINRFMRQFKKIFDIYVFPEPFPLHPCQFDSYTTIRRNGVLIG
jgi:hypothetical protein